MPDTFTPLATVTGSPGENESSRLKVLTQTESKPAFEPMPLAGASEPACTVPAMTLQRTGDVVTGIRIQCGCGQVIDLACNY
jgi:hypothetical protein